MNDFLPSYLVGFTLGNLLFIGICIYWRLRKVFKECLYYRRIFHEPYLTQHFRQAGQPMLGVSKVIMFWCVLASRWNHLTKPHINHRKDESAISRLCVGASEAIKPPSNDATCKQSCNQSCNNTDNNGFVIHKEWRMTPRYYSCVRSSADKECAGPRERGLLAESEPIRMVEAVRETTNKGDQHMKSILRFVGLDVHKDEIARMRVDSRAPEPVGCDC